MNETLNTVDEVIDAFGGTNKAAEIFGYGASAISNWRAKNRFPPHMHMRVFVEAKSRRINVGPSLIGMAPEEPRQK